MGDYSTSQMKSDLGAVIALLQPISDTLSGLDSEQKVFDRAVAKNVCNVPVFAGGLCKASVPDDVTVGEYFESVKAILRWLKDLELSLTDLETEVTFNESGGTS